MADPVVDLEMYFDTIIIQVDGRLTRVPRKLFASSPVFQDMFSMPQNPEAGAIPDGSDNEHPLVLNGIEYDDYIAFVRTANVTEISQSPLPQLKCREFGAVYKLALLWEMDKLKNALLSQVPAMFESPELAAEQLHLAQLFQNGKITNAIENLIGRGQPLSYADMQLLGPELFARLTILREKHRSAVVKPYAGNLKYTEMLPSTASDRREVAQMCQNASL